jgi:hypothetical protein
MRRLYGTSPLHLVAHVAVFALIGFAVVELTGVRPHLYVLGWFVGAIILHDAVLLPLYAGLDRLGTAALGGAVNHVRLPLAISGLLALVYFPVILGKGSAAYERVSGLTYEGYAARWLGITGALFAASGVLYVLRSRSRGGVQRSAGSRS